MRTIFLLALVACLAAAPIVAHARQDAGSRVEVPGNRVTAPVIVKEVRPQYTVDAMKAGVQGSVTLEGVVQPDGVIGEVRVTKALYPGLDQEAIKAIKLWRFKPGRKDGKPVPVRVTVEMTFTLGNPPAQPRFQVQAPAPGATGGKDQKHTPLVYKPGAGVSAPVVLKEARPQYTAEARKARIEGTVLLDCVVETDGSVGDIEVKRSLDEALDQEAIKAVKQWRFEPGTKDGKPVPVLITLEMTFTLR
jgi:TonB family protein